MPVKEVEVEEIGSIKLYKRKGSRSIKISVSTDNSVRVTLPSWAPYSSGLAFVRSKKEWIHKQRSKQLSFFKDFQMVGKAHHLHFVRDERSKNIRTKILGNIIEVKIPQFLDPSDPTVQKTTQLAVNRALKKEADILLPQRLKNLSDKTGLSFKSMSTRNLKTRWGSCNQNKEIVLNIFLMQLPWECIDYVILHELTHTKILHHGPLFWAELEKHLPDAKKIKQTMRLYKPDARINENAYAL